MNEGIHQVQKNLTVGITDMQTARTNNTNETQKLLCWVNMGDLDGSNMTPPKDPQLIISHRLIGRLYIINL